MNKITEVVRGSEEKLREMFDYFPDSYYKGIVGKKGSKYDNTLSDINDIKSFLHSSLLSLLEAVGSEITQSLVDVHTDKSGKTSELTALFLLISEAKKELEANKEK